MAGNRYDSGWRGGRGYGREYGTPRASGPQRGRYDAGMRGRYDAGMRPRDDRGWTEPMAYGREAGMGMAHPGMFTPFGWDPMMRWSGWDPMMGFVPYQDTPRQWSYGLAEDARRYEHDFYRGNTARAYGRDYSRPRYDGDHHGALPPRQSPLYGRGGDRAVREWARQRGYDVEHIIQPRLGPRR
jgi:hypothetical protein